MRSYFGFTLNWLGVLLLSMLFFPINALAQPPVDVQKGPIRLNAADVLPASLLKGKNYSIGAEVLNHGFINSYVLQSNYGTYQVESTMLLKIRINELYALNHMEAVESSSVFKDALIKGAKAPIELAKNLVVEPVDTVTNTVSGIGRWFSDIGRSLVSDDPYQDNALKTAFGYASVKRQFAYLYGIDPYTEFEPVQKQLSKISQVAFTGGLTPRLAFQAIPDATGTVVRVTSTSESMRQLVRDKSPGELEKINKQKLLAMGISDKLASAFLNNRNYSPQDATLLIGELESMPQIKGRDIFISLATLANEKSVARFMLRRAQMISNYSKTKAPVREIIDINGSAVLIKKDGGLVGLAPLDHVAWTTSLMVKMAATKKAMQNSQKFPQKELWFEGTVDPQARRALEADGWVVKQW